LKEIVPIEFQPILILLFIISIIIIYLYNSINNSLHSDKM
jgi:hypothetical protein